MRLPLLAALGIVAYLVTLVASAPATLLAGLARDASRGIVELRGATGTVWNGRAAATITPRGAGPIEVESIEWRWQPARLLAGELAFAVTATAAALDARAEVARGFSTWQLRDLAAAGDAQRIAAWVPLAGTWQPAGRMRIESPALSWDGQALAGAIAAEWKDAAVSLSALRPLGTYRAEIDARQSPATVAVSTVEGPMVIRGQGTLALPRRAAFGGEARPRDEASRAALEPLLNLIGPRRPDGAHAIDWRLR